MKKKYLFLVLMIFYFTDTFSQTNTSYLIRNTNVSSGCSYQSWSDENDITISELVIPFSLITVVDRNISLSASTNTAYAKLNSSGDKIFGFTDMRIAGTFITKGNNFLISVGATIPTGKTKLDQGQTSVASAISQYPLNFRVPSYSQGLAFNIACSYAFEAGNFIFGTGFGIVYKRGFVPFSNSDAVYKPGSEFSVNTGCETRIGGRNGTRLSLDFNYTLYGPDTYKSNSASVYERIFKSGNKAIVNFRSFTKIKNFDLVFYLRERTKGKNEIRLVSLKEESKNSNGNQLDIGSMGFIHLTRDFTIESLVECKIYSKNEYQQNGAFILGLGGGINYFLTRDFLIGLNLKISSGKLSNGNNDTTIKGYDINCGLKYNI